MKFSLLLLLLLPLHSFAQFGRSYTGPTMQQNQQSRQDFNRMTNQRTQDFQSQQMQRHWSRPNGQPMTKETLLQAQAKQQKLEQEANEKLAHLVQEQQRKRLEHPAKNPQMAASQQKADDRQLTVLTVKNYREVFLPWQVYNVQEAQKLTPSAQRGLQNLNKNLLDDAWWSKPESAPLLAKITAYSDTLSALTTGLLGFDPASPPTKPTPQSVSSFDSRLAKDAFDQEAATQLLREASLTERLLAYDQLAKAVKEFSTLSASAATSPELQNEPKKLRKEVQKSLHTVNKEMARYNDRIATSYKVSLAAAALRQSTSAYLAKNSK